LTPVEFYEAHLDFSIREHAKSDEMIKMQWEIMRTQTFYIFNMSPYKKHALENAAQLFKLPWDKEIEIKRQSTEELKAGVLRMASVFKLKVKQGE